MELCFNVRTLFSALFTHSEVFFSPLEGLALRPLIFDFPRSTMQKERLNDCLLIFSGEKVAFVVWLDWTDFYRKVHFSSLSVGAASGSFRNDPADRYFCTEPKRERNFDY